jgi:hypothetical protein
VAGRVDEGYASEELGGDLVNCAGWLSSVAFRLVAGGAFSEGGVGVA